MPYAINQGGWISIIWIPISAFFVFVSGCLLNRCLYKKAERLEGFLEVGKLAYGNLGKNLIEINQSSILLGSSALFLILSSYNFQILFPSLKWSFERWLILCYITSCTPFILTKSLKEAAILSYFGVSSTVIMTIVILYISLLHYNYSDNNNNYSSINLSNLPLTLSSISYSLGGNTIFPHVEKSMKTPKKFNKMLFLSIVFVSLLYFFVGFFGYLSYGSHAQSPIFNNFKSGILVNIAVAMLTLHALVTIPLFLTNLSLDTESRFYITEQDNRNNNFKRIIFRVIISMLSFLIAYCIPYFSDFMNLLGSLSNSLLTYILPALFYIKIFEFGKNKFEAISIFGLLSIGGFTCVVGTFKSIILLLNDIKF